MRDADLVAFQVLRLLKTEVPEVAEKDNIEKSTSQVYAHSVISWQALLLGLVAVIIAVVFLRIKCVA